MMFFNSASRAYDRVKQLADAGYLERRYITQIATAPAASPMVFTIAKLGAQVLVDTYGYDADDLYFAGSQMRNWQSLQPILAVNDIRAAIFRACDERPPFELVRWWIEARFRAAPDEVTVTNRRGRPGRKPVLPDGYCLIRAPAGYAHYFIEADKGSEGHKQFRSQVEIYQAYVTSGQYQQRFKTTSLRVLIVTTSPRRRDNLRRTTRGAGGKELYLFSTFDQMQPEAVLTEPIWYPATGEDAVALLTL